MTKGLFKCCTLGFQVFSGWLWHYNQKCIKDSTDEQKNMLQRFRSSPAARRPYEPVSSEPMLTLRNRCGSSWDGRVRRDILLPPKGLLRMEGSTLCWLMAGCELQCSRLERDAGLKRKAEGRWEGTGTAGVGGVSLEV